MRKLQQSWFVLALGFFAFTQTASADTAAFLGTWINPRPGHAIWGKVVITQDSNGALQVARFGACGPHGTSFCDDGSSTLTLYPRVNGALNMGLSEGASESQGTVFATRTMMFKLNETNGVLTVTTFTRFTDPNRGIYVEVDKFDKQ